MKILAHIFATLLFASVLYPGCTATPLPLPPEMDPDKVAMSIHADGQVAIEGQAGALRRTATTRLWVRSLGSDGTVSFVPNEDGSFSVVTLGERLDIFRFSYRSSTGFETLADIVGVYFGLGGGPYGVESVRDSDGDGFFSHIDCNDGDIAINPSAAEICGNDIDENCDGSLNTSCVGESCTDEDADGFGVGEGCEGPDCNDSDSLAYPGSPEFCDGIDNDCNGEVDDYCLAECASVSSCGECPGSLIPGCIDGMCACLEPSECGEERCGDGLDNDCDGEIDDGCPLCSTDDECHDEFFCNGEEICSGGICSPVFPPICDDGLAETYDYCSEDARACVSEPL